MMTRVKGVRVDRAAVRAQPEDLTAPVGRVGKIVRPPFGAPHPEALDYASWYLATIVCAERHSLPLFPSEENDETWPCATCRQWATTTLTDALDAHRKTLHAEKEKGSRRGPGKPRKSSRKSVRRSGKHERGRGAGQ